MHQPSAQVHDHAVPCASLATMNRASNSVYVQKQKKTNNTSISCLVNLFIVYFFIYSHGQI